MRIAVIGGGIAGLGAAFALRRAAKIIVLERAPQVFAHASGKNAAIYRPLELPLPITQLARANASLLDELVGDRAAWLRACGLLLVARSPGVLAPLAIAGTAAGIDHAWLGSEELRRRAPSLAGGEARTALSVPGAGVIDGHGVAMALVSHIRAAGGEVRTGVDVERICVSAGRVTGVLCAGGVLAADAVIIAGGAYARALGESCGAPLPLEPFIRHLVLLDVVPALPESAPVVWDVEQGVYFRPESAAVLASPGDRVPSPPCDPTARPEALVMLADKLATLAPLVGRAGVRRSWACLRTFAPDGLPVAGADHRVRGLFWLAGLGGYGLSAGLGIAEVLAATVMGDDHALLGDLSPARFG
ncbi:MAG: FAD-binding oxidoreductase [Deltaproteobacteria bacterium]|nr:FAD-binding oxidoreductase [Deltaproteobacteria bacterium]